MTTVDSATLELAPTALAVRQIGPWLRGALMRDGRQDLLAMIGRAELATHEACMNIINHSMLEEGATITCRLRLEVFGFTVLVTDTGDPFDPTTVDVPEDGFVQERGYGVKIIRSLSQVTYRRHDGRNELELRITHEEAQ